MTEVGKELTEGSLKFSIPVADFLDGAACQPYLYVDTETNGEDIRDGRGYCQGVSLAYVYAPGQLAFTYLPLRHRFSFNYEGTVKERLREVLTFRDEHEFPNVYHNSKFDIVSLLTLGYPLRKNVHYDTMLMSHLLNENLFAQSLNGSLAHWCGGDVEKQMPLAVKKIIDVMGWGAVPSEMMWSYAATDAALLIPLHQAMQKQWKSEGLDDYWHNHKRKTIEVVQAMERRGTLIDQEMCKRNILTGTMVMEDMVELLGINPSSPIGLKKLLLDELHLPEQYHKKTGNITFDKGAMEIYEQILERQSSDTAAHILTYRGWQKTVSSNYTSYLELLSPDGRLRPSYKLHGTKTGRFSCERPNLQQIPKKSVKSWNGDTKRAFIAPEGYTLYEADYSQLELRLATAYADERELKEVFANSERDIFTEMSQTLGLTRQDTKTFVYSTQYGAGNKRISDVFGVSKDRAAEMRRDYYRHYPGFRRITDTAAKAAESKGYCKLWTGRRRHFMWPKSESHKALNSVIQGGAADIMESRMHELYRGIDNPDCQMLLQVHDSVVFQIKDTIAESVLPEIKEMMENVQPDFGVKFAVDVHKFGQ